MSVFETVPIFGALEITEASGESFTRETGENPRVSRAFYIRGAQDASTAYSALISWLYANFDDGYGNIASYNIPLNAVRLTATDSPFLYKAECEFAYRSDDSNAINDPDYIVPDIEDDDYSYSTGGGTRHITHSYGTTSLHLSGETARSFGNGIGWNGEGFDGLDVQCPHAEFSIDVSVPRRFFNQTYRLALANMTGGVNLAPWNGFPARCVQFKGVSSRKQKFSYSGPRGEELYDWYWRASYAFEARPQETVTFGGNTAVKGGFDHMWNLTDTVVDGYGNVGSQVVQINIEQVYPAFNFSALQLPLV